MFKGNPRKPGTLSFENIRFVLDEERMSRLRRKWEGKLTVPSDHDGITEELNDEFMIAHLSSDGVTGLLHEINVLTSMNILSIQPDGMITLSTGWEDRVPHMMLVEMHNLWGSEVDTNDLYCIHDKIKVSLESHWEHHDDKGWRRAFIRDDSDGDDLILDDIEYQLREQFFTENYYNWLSEKSGMGEFGI